MIRILEFYLSLIIARLAYIAIRLLNRSSGTSFVGMMTLKICPDFLAHNMIPSPVIFSESPDLRLSSIITLCFNTVKLNLSKPVRIRLVLLDRAVYNQFFRKIHGL